MPHHVPQFVKVTIRECSRGLIRDGYAALGRTVYGAFPRWYEALGPGHGGSEAAQQRCEFELEALPIPRECDGVLLTDTAPFEAFLRWVCRDILALVPKRRHHAVARGFALAWAELGEGPDLE